MSSFLELNTTIEAIFRKRIFFIVGSLKSGTTWLQKILNSHSEICCKGESHLADRFIPRLEKVVSEHNALIESKNLMLYGRDIGYPQLDRYDQSYLSVASLCLYLHKQTSGRHYDCIGEKTPDHVHLMPELLALVPHAKFIHIIRDGRDCAVSGWFHLQRVNNNSTEVEKLYPTIGSYVAHFVHRWVKDVSEGIQFGHLHPHNYCEVRYESLVRDSTAVIQRLFEFLGVESTSKIVNHAARESTFEKLSGGRVPGVEDRNSHYRKGIIGDWKNCFDEESQHMFSVHGTNLLRKLGYVDGGNE